MAKSLSQKTTQRDVSAAPPHDLDAEMSVLGSILLDPPSITKVQEFLRPEDFYRENNGQVFRAAMDMFAAGEAIDNVTLAAHLQTMGLLERIGGRTELASMQAAVPTAANIEHYARIVREHADRRGLGKLLATAALSLRDDSADAVRVLADLEAQLPRIGNGLWRRAVPSRPSVGVRLDRVSPEKVSWLWQNRMPLGKVALLDGDPGLGKTTLLLDIAARVTTGSPMPDGTPCGRKGGVVVITIEDGLGDTIVPRLEAAGADLSKVVALTTIPVIGAGDRLIDLPLDVDKLRDAAHEVDACMVMVDPLIATLNSTVDSHRDQDVRRALAPVSNLAAELDAYVAATRHLNKNSTAPGLYRGGGSIAFTGLARSVVLVTKDPDDPEHRIVSWLKNSLAAPQPSLRYRLDGSSGVLKIVWEGASSYTAEQLVASQSTTAEDRSALAEAKTFLLELLDSGPVPAKKVVSQARAAGIATKTVERAKESLGVASRKTPGLGGIWQWHLPDRSATQGAQVPTSPVPPAALDLLEDIL